MKFKNFIQEMEDNIIVDPLSVIKKSLAEMSPEELDDFGVWLIDELFDNIEEEDELDYDSIIELIQDLTSEDLEYIVHMLDYDEYDDDNNFDVSEAKFKAKNRNKKKTKRFQKSKAQFRAGKAKRKKANRANKADRKKYYRANKNKIKKYSKSYNKAVKSGKHNKKIRR